MSEIIHDRPQLRLADNLKREGLPSIKFDNFFQKYKQGKNNPDPFEQMIRNFIRALINNDQFHEAFKIVASEDHIKKPFLRELELELTKIREEQ